MILLHLKGSGRDMEHCQSLIEFACEVFEQPEGLDVTICQEKSKGKEICEFQQALCCRTCGSPDLNRQEMFVGNPIFWPKWKTEPSAEEIMIAYYCDICERLTMVSEAVHCSQCGLTLFLQDKDNEIVGVQEA